MDRSIKPQLVKLSKLEVARRRIESAIWLWFLDGDPVSIQTLAAAAHRTLGELARLWETEAWPSTARYVAKRSETQRRTSCDDAVSFFKEAKEDECDQISQQWTELELFDAVMAYSNLAPDRCGSALMSTFVVRFGVERPELFVRDAFSLIEKKISKSFNLERLERLSKIEFLKEFIGFLGRPIA
jgi:hypothetical protein